MFNSNGESEVDIRYVPQGSTEAIHRYLLGYLGKILPVTNLDSCPPIQPRIESISLRPTRPSTFRAIHASCRFCYPFLHVSFSVPGQELENVPCMTTFLFFSEHNCRGLSLIHLLIIRLITQQGQALAKAIRNFQNI
jgi:hypothetical protein